MKLLSRYLASIIIVAMTLSLTYTSASAQSSVIYQSSTKENITSGATLERITRFTTDGWLKINVLRVDLSNSNIRVDTLANSDSISKTATTGSLAQSKGAVAAINGGFFNWITVGAYPDGPIVESGKVISASSEYNRYSDSMGTFSLDVFNQALFTYWKTDMSIKSAIGSILTIGQYNKPSSDYTDFTVIDKRWSMNTTGVSSIYPDLAEMIVDQGKVVEIRTGKGSTVIPQNGFAVITRQAGAVLLQKSFKPGDVVTFDIKTTPDWSKIKTAVTGSAILIKDGKIPFPFSFDIPGRQPRTTIGSSKDGKQLIMVTIDGRQNSSIGMTQSEVAQLMIELGAYNALNLDGGGSTTMVSRKPGSADLNVVNSPSDGMQRSISDALGIFSIAPPSQLDGLIIDTEDSNVFINTSRKFNVRGYDKYLNPYDLSKENISWSTSGVNGQFTNGTFTATSAGKGKIKVSIGNISREIEINVLEGPTAINMSIKSLNLVKGQSSQITVRGIDKNGFGASIDPEDMTWSVTSSTANTIGTINKGLFTAMLPGTGYIDCSKNGVHAYCPVSIATDITLKTDSFESNNGTFTSYPAFVGGSYSLTSEKVLYGAKSGKLSYDFTNTEGTRAAYMVYKDGGLELPSGTSKLGLWVYNDHSNPSWLRAEILTLDGKKSPVDFIKGMHWTGWKYVEAPLSGISNPVRLTRLYLVSVSPVSDSGSIFMDQLTLVKSDYPVINLNDYPQSTIPVDEALLSPGSTAGTAAFNFTAFGESAPPRNLLQKILGQRFTDIADKFDAASYVGQAQHSNLSLFKIPVLGTYSGFKSLDFNNSKLIQLDISSGGVRTSDPGQWSWLLNQLDTSGSRNVFIFMAKPPESFSDSLEGALFKNILADYKSRLKKNIWVFFKGTSNISVMDRGVKYISLAGWDIPGLVPETAGDVKYALVHIDNENASYEFRSVIE